MNIREKLRIVQGNDFYLMIKVVDNRVFETPSVDMSLVSNLTVNLLRGKFTRNMTAQHTIMESNKSIIVVKCTDLQLGSYGIEVSYKKNGLKCCARELEVFSIVYRNCESDYNTSPINPEPCNSLDLMVAVYGIPTSSSGGSSSGGSGTTPVFDKAYYGVSDNFPYSISSINGLTAVNCQTLGKTAISYTLGQSVVVLIPKDSTLKAYQDDGFGANVPFNESESGVQVGCNGQIVTIGDKQYKAYGQLFLNNGTCYIYIK